MEFDQQLLSEVGQLLQNSKETIAFAESVTSGLLQFTFSQITDASEFYRGGITAYTLEEKVKFLKVDKDEAEHCDCVSAHIAEQMAAKVAETFETDWGIAVTGYATPVKESDYEIFAWFSFSYKNSVVFTKKLDLHPRTQPYNAQMYYSEFIIGCLKIKLEENSNTDLT